MSQIRVLSINTYGGSLLLGASQLKADIIGSYEDKGFGSSIQAENFPHLELRRHISQWPDSIDLSDTIVVAHPPCSAFSVQNTSPAARGVDSDAFACTTKVLSYAMKHRAVAIAVESVVGALSGAWRVHQDFADQHRYHLYRVLQNGSMFGPQWRERFWAVYVKAGAASSTLSLSLKPRWATVGEVIRGHEHGPAAGNTDELLARLKTDLLAVTGCDVPDMDFFLNRNHQGGMLKVLSRRMYDTDPGYELAKTTLGGFTSGMMCYLNPDGLAGTLLGSTWWYVNSRNLAEDGYKAIMGFPTTYQFPGATRRNMRTYLSKGVIPQVAAWVIGQVANHLGMKHESDCTCQGCFGIDRAAYQVEVQPDEIADLRYRRSDWSRRFVQAPVIRHVEDR